MMESQPEKFIIFESQYSTENTVLKERKRNKHVDENRTRHFFRIVVCPENWFDNCFIKIRDFVVYRYVSLKTKRNTEGKFFEGTLDIQGRHADCSRQ